MAKMLSMLNRLLPFATPGTPLIQDFIHLAAICLLLYFAPQIQALLQGLRGDMGASSHGVPDNSPITLNQEDPQGLPEEPLDADRIVNREHEPEEEPVIEFQDDDNHHQNVVEAGQPGPARAPNTTTQRNVGAKKAKALALRDQRRAYNEFMRSQGEAQRARDAEGAAEREAAIAAEKERRKAAAAAWNAKTVKEREERRLREQQDRIEELKRRDLAVSIVKEELAASNMCDLFKVAEEVGGDVDEEWLEKLLDAAGVLGRKGNTLTMVTSMGWAVIVTMEQMANLYITAAENGMGDEHGRIDMDELGVVLETMLRA